MRTLAFVFLLLVAPGLSLTAGAQNSLDEARAQYEAAAYEEALATLTRVADAAPANRVEVEQYRALCLIALGNITDAERAVAALVAADPTYVPSSSVASPKVLSMVADIRRKELPSVARRLLDAGRIAFQGKDLVAAEQHFGVLLKLLDDPALAGHPERDGLNTLAQGFVTLIAAAAPPPAPALDAERAAAASTAPPVAPAAAPPAAATTAPAGLPEPAAAGEFYVPATAIEQRLPEWEPPTTTIARFEYSGRLRLRIGTDGRVTAASIEEASHPSYDARLLEVAPGWLYKPATRDGVPIESEKVIAIRLRAQE